MNSRLGILQIINSTLWITVLVVRVGCIIEAHPSPSNSNINEDNENPYRISRFHLEGYEDDTHETELETAASHSILTSPQNALISNNGGRLSDSFSKKESFRVVGNIDGKSLSVSSSTTKKNSQLIIVETTPFPIASPSASSLSSSTSSSQARSKENETPDTSSPVFSSNKEKENDDDSNSSSNNNNRMKGNTEETDSCSGKADGYYQNFGSGCTSYYYCAAGYQITYVCPVGLKFNGKRCESEYKCPSKTKDGHRISNDCERKSNGYYSSRNGVGKYFYCFQQAKVIELQCDPGKIFVKDKCVLASNDETNGNRGDREEVVDYTDTSCFKKSNGFYQDLTTNCEMYYFCIGGEKNELRCQDEYIFNGDICVHRSRYECPIELVKSQKRERVNNNDSGANGYEHNDLVTKRSPSQGSSSTTTRKPIDDNVGETV